MTYHEVPISAFNLMPGAVYTEKSNAEDPKPRLVVTSVLYRHTSSERIGVTVRHLDVRDARASEDTDPPLYEAPSYHFVDTVYLIGLCVNPDSWDDDDIGQDI
jgi:hypothetical protein